MSPGFTKFKAVPTIDIVSEKFIVNYDVVNSIKKMNSR